MAITDGMYEIRSALDPTMALDVAGASAVRGANVQLYAANGTNAQKFDVSEASAGEWAIQSVASSLYVDVAGGAASDGTNVQQWTSNGSRAQRWKLAETGTTVSVDGVTCKVVTIGSYVTADGATYMMDVKGALTTNRTNIQIYHANSTEAQQFVLVPTGPLDAGMPVPMGLAWATSVGGEGRAQQVVASKLYPTWSFTDAWGDLTDHGFELRYRTRLLDAGYATPGAWGAWTAWATASVTAVGTTAWLTAGITATIAAGYKQLDVQLEVRPTTDVGAVTWHGHATSATLTALYAPTVTATAAKMGPDGLALTLSTDYDGGTTVVRVTSAVGGGAELLAGPVEATGFYPTFSALVPAGAMLAVPDPADISTLDVAYVVGTDQYVPRLDQSTSSVAYAWAPSDSVTVTPTVTYGADAVARAKVTAGSTRHGWIYAGGVARELVMSATDTFLVPYPFGEACVAYLVAEGSGVWGHHLLKIAANQSGKVKPCHAWTWEVGTLVLETSTSDVVTDRTIKGTANAYELVSRPWQAVTFGEVMEGTFRASGAIHAGSASSLADVVALAKAHHALYRAPSGEVADVAVTDVQYEAAKHVAEVSVSMVQEAR